MNHFNCELIPDADVKLFGHERYEDITAKFREAAKGKIVNSAAVKKKSSCISHQNSSAKMSYSMTTLLYWMVFTPWRSATPKWTQD
jgi:hypothetical protein